MATGLRQVGRVATVAFFVALALPAGALAGRGGGGSKCNASACQVYHEQGVPNAGGQQQPSQQPQNHTGSTKQNGKQKHVSAKVSKVLSEAGTDRGPLSRLLTGSGPGAVQAGSGIDVVAPSALGAAVDLGAGPTVLLVILFGTAVALAAHGGFRSWRRRRPTV